MDLCAKAKIKDVTVYCNCSAPTSENLEEDDYNYINYKELYFEPSFDKKIETFWKYLEYQNVPLPRAGRPISSKHRKRQQHAKIAEKHAKIDEKQVKLDEKLKQDAAFKTTKWADKLAYFQNKGYDKILAQKRSCKICNNDNFGPLFADMNCREIVSGLPGYRQAVHKKVEITTDKNEYITAADLLFDADSASLSSNKLAQKSTKSLDGPKGIGHSLSDSIKSIQSSHSMIDVTQASVYEKITQKHYVYPNLPQANMLSAYSDTNQPKAAPSIIQIFNTAEFLNYSNTDIIIGPHIRRPKRILFHEKQESRRSAAIIKSICSLPDTPAPSACVSSTTT